MRHEFAKNHPFGLTRRQDEILRALAEGAPADDVAEQLGLAYKTVKAHITRILPKMKARSTLHAVTIGFRSGLLK